MGKTPRLEAHGTVRGALLPHFVAYFLRVLSSVPPRSLDFGGVHFLPLVQPIATAS